jgi:glycosyltransferase A (GT-A) superfamily protein (DUF2064 family)
MAVEPSRPIAFAVMAKAPIPGEAKTRLGRLLGQEAAVAIYRAFLLDTVATLTATATRFDTTARLLICPDERHASEVRLLVDSTWTALAQSRNGLMEGIVDAFEAGFARGADLVAVSDADSPLTLEEHLATCLVIGAANDVALGPTIDGGYYLITGSRASRTKLPELLLDRRYDSATICDATVEQARSLDLRIGLGPSGFDIDTGEDLLKLFRSLERLPAAKLAHTRKALATLDLGFAIAAS